MQTNAGVSCILITTQKVEAWEMGSIWQREYIRTSSSYGSAYEPINSVVPVGSPVAV